MEIITHYSNETFCEVILKTKSGKLVEVSPRTEAHTSKNDPFIKIKYVDYTGYSKGFQKL